MPLDLLPARVRLATPMDDDELFELCRVNRDLRIERTASGELIIMPPAGGESGRRNLAVAGQFWNWVQKDGSGIGFDSSAGFVLPNGAERSPDAAWVRRERWEALSVTQRRKFPRLCPEFVIELRSPSEKLRDLEEKMKEYVDNGSRLGWLIDPDARRVTVFRPGQPAQRLENPATVSGEAELPGFVLDLTLVW